MLSSGFAGWWAISSSALSFPQNLSSLCLWYRSWCWLTGHYSQLKLCCNFCPCQQNRKLFGNFKILHCLSYGTDGYYKLKSGLLWRLRLKMTPCGRRNGSTFSCTLNISSFQTVLSLFNLYRCRHSIFVSCSSLTSLQLHLIAFRGHAGIFWPVWQH